ncbi:MAG: DUF2809 domain-containing protein [Rhizobacter sp.]|nr:DUF2809 domain-containing protein [Ferruginibacter sp.]
MIVSRLHYFMAGSLLFCLEVFIALYVHDDIIRPHIGDLLVVIMMYCFLKSFFNFTVLTTAIISLLFSYLIEFLQYLKIVEILGLQRSTLAKVVIGTHFSWIDIWCYTAGIVTVLLAEKMLNRRKGINATL